MLQAIIACLQHPSPPAKIGAFRATRDVCPKIPAEILSPYVDVIFSALVSVIPGSAEDILLLLMSTMMVAMKVDASRTCKYEPAITPTLLEAWKNSSNDPLICQDITFLFKLMLKIPSCFPGLMIRLTPVISSILSTPVSTDISLSALVILKDIVEVAPIDFPVPLRYNFSPLISLLTNTDEVDLIEAGALCLRAYVHRFGKQLISWYDPCFCDDEAILATKRQKLWTTYYLQSQACWIRHVPTLERLVLHK